MINEIETKLWKAVDALRGNLSSEEYVHVIISLLALKQINNKHQFLISPKAMWTNIITKTSEPYFGDVINDAFIALEDMNPILEGIFDKNLAKEGVDSLRLGEVVRILDSIEIKDGEEDLIGRIYEYFLGMFFRDRGQKGGEFYTPKTVVNLIVRILKPHDKIYDPTCGTGGMLIQSRQYLKETHRPLDDLIAYGQEFNNTTWKIAKLNFILNDLPLIDSNKHLVLGSKNADTLRNDLHQGMCFDTILANPPFNVKNWGYEELIGDKRWVYGSPPKGNANYAFIEHIISKLTPTGKAAVVLANGSLSSSQKDELAIRKALVEANIVDCIVELPDKLFYTTGIPACIWFFNKKKESDDVLMVSSAMIQGNMISKKLRELTHEDIVGIVDLVEKHQNKEIVEVLGKAKCVNKEELAANDYSFVPGRYVGVETQEVDHEALKKDIETLSIELNSLLDEFNNIVPNVKEAIKKALAYENEDENESR